MDSIYKYPKINGKTNYDVSFERDRLGVCLVVSLNYRDVSLLSSQSVRNNKPPAMRVRDRCYTKKSPFHSIIELFKLNNTNRKVILWQTKRTACLIQNECVNITLCLLQNTGEK